MEVTDFFDDLFKCLNPAIPNDEKAIENEKICVVLEFLILLICFHDFSIIPQITSDCSQSLFFLQFIF